MFFVMSKILWYIISPFNIVLICMIASLIFFDKKRRIAKGLIASALLIVFAIGTHFIPSAMMKQLENRILAGDIAGKVEGIIVLAGMVDMHASRSGLVELTDQADRIIEGIILSKKYPEAKLIITGGSGGLNQREIFQEAVYLEKLALLLGVESSKIIIESNSRNTREHVVELVRILPNFDKFNWILVTSAFHMPRAVGCFRKAGFPILPYPVDYKTDATGRDRSFLSGMHPKLCNIELFNTAIHEWIGLIIYKLSGYTNSIFPK